jgi:glycosyltransferase involved in cell wall biosynthesis
MHVVQVHHSRLPVAGYGGAQRIVVWLAYGLAELGHDVTVVSAPGSVLPGLRCVAFGADVPSAATFDVRRLVSGPIDVLHFHAPPLSVPDIPWVHTLHGNMGPGRRTDAHAICVSEDHARRHGTRSFVHNGVRLEEYRYQAAKGDFDLFMARLHRVKGWRTAAAIARRCKIRLVLAGGWRPSLSRYVRFVGEVSGDRKRDLLARARCLWMPVSWDDPCPVNVLEAMASGTPVIGTPRGSLPELIGAEGGGIGATEDALIALRQRLDRWDPAAVRSRAERFFSHLRMARDYVRMYEHLLARGSLPPGRRADADGQTTW